MVKATPRSPENVSRLSWLAFACAVAVLAALPVILTPDNDPAIWLVPVPALLLALGGFRSGAERRYALACLALGTTMDALLLIFMVLADGPREPTWVTELFGGLWVATAPTALIAGAVPAVQSMRGRISPVLGVVGGVVSMVGGLVGAFILWRLATFT